jgi:hypothetical protein
MDDGDGQLVMGIESTQRIAMDGWLVTVVDSFGPSSRNFLYQTKCSEYEHCG